MLRKVRHFFTEYKQLGYVLLSALAGLVLDLSGYHNAAHLILGASALINAAILLKGMFDDLREGTYGLDILAVTAIVTSVLLHEYWAGMVIVLMLTGGEALEDYAESRAKTELSALLAHKPKKAHLLIKGRSTDVNVSSLRVGDRIIVKPGEVVPVDGEITDGVSSFDESSLTGESLPVDKEKGGQVMSGSINMEGAVTIKALRTAEDSQYEQIIKLVESAASSQSPFVRLADRYSIPFTIISFIIAGIAWAVSGQAIRFLEVIVVATPCPLLLGAPIALIGGMSRSAKNGIIVKTGSAIERLAEIQTLAFDKTGTLTMGTPLVHAVTAYGGFKRADVLSYAAAVEQSSQHILAHAILQAAADDKIKIPKAKQVKETSGHGLSGQVDKHDVLVGRFNLLREQQVTIPKTFKASAYQQTATYVAVDGKLAGVITFKDEVRPEAKAMLERIRAAGIHTLMVTGDNAAAAETIAKQLGIEKVIADCLPADKIKAIKGVRNHPVAFAGDGVNDAPVLTASDVGIALGARGATAASESADVVILVDDVSKVATGIEIAKRTFFIAKQSILIGIGISVGLMLIFSTGHFKPVYGAAIQELVDVTVILNALRAHGSWR